MNETDKANFFETTFTGSTLSTASRQTFGEFLCAQASSVQPADESNPFFQIVKEELSHRMDTGEKSVFTNDFIHSPMIQMADGAILLTDGEVFLNNLAANEMVSARKGRYLVNQQCSTITNISSTRQQTGPAYAQWGGRTTRVFDASMNRLRHSTPETLSDADILLADTDTGVFNAPERLRQFVGKTYPSAALALRAMNEVLWPFSSKLLLHGEDLSSRVTARALKE